MNWRAFQWFLVAGVLVGMLEVAWAAHPLVTDDTGTQGRGNSQVELNSDRARFAGDRVQVASGTYTYGVLDNLDMFGNLPATLSTPSGINDVSLGAKWRFAESETSSVGIKPELLLPTGNEHRGLGSGKTSMALTLLVSHDIAPWTFHGNIGLAVSRYRIESEDAASRRVVWRASSAAVYELTSQTRLVSDIGIAQNTAKAARTHPAFFLVGLIYSPTKNIDLDIGFKTGLNAAEVDHQAGVGLTFRY